MMEVKSMRERYTGVAIVLHWLIAAAVLFMIGLGWTLEDMPKGTPQRTYWFNLHKSIGVTIGVLVVLRLLWRLTHRPPALPSSMPAWEVTAARINHVLLYALLIAMPVIGFLASNFTKFGVKYFGLQIGPFFPEDQGLRDTLQGLHGALSWVLFALIVLHVLAALKHWLIDKDRVFQRMLPG
jgi:cytochrome b561